MNARNLCIFSSDGDFGNHNLWMEGRAFFGKEPRCLEGIFGPTLLEFLVELRRKYQQKLGVAYSGHVLLSVDSVIPAWILLRAGIADHGDSNNM
jgi:hypothetical protein